MRDLYGSCGIVAKIGGPRICPWFSRIPSGFGLFITFGDNVIFGYNINRFVLLIAAPLLITLLVIIGLLITLLLIMGLLIIGLLIACLLIIGLLLISRLVICPIRIEDSVIMLGKLIVPFGSNMLACGRRVASERQVFFVNLLRRAADLAFWAITVMCLISRGLMTFPAIPSSRATASRIRALLHTNHFLLSLPVRIDCLRSRIHESIVLYRNSRQIRILGFKFAHIPR